MILVKLINKRIESKGFIENIFYIDYLSRRFL